MEGGGYGTRRRRETETGPGSYLGRRGRWPGRKPVVVEPQDLVLAVAEGSPTASLAASFLARFRLSYAQSAGDGGATGAASATSSTDSASEAGSLFSLANSS